jgi:hypothetical protein
MGVLSGLGRERLGVNLPDNQIGADGKEGRQAAQAQIEKMQPFSFAIIV